MACKPVVLTIDTILAVLRDYCKEEDIPADTIAMSLCVNPTEKSKLAILAESPQWKTEAPLDINFDIRRVFGVS